MAEQNIRLLVLGFLFLGLFVSCQCVHLHGFIIQAAESREVKLGRRFMFDDTVSRFFQRFFTLNSRQNFVVFLMNWNCSWWRGKKRWEGEVRRILQGRTLLGIDTHRQSMAEHLWDFRLWRWRMLKFNGVLYIKIWHWWDFFLLSFLNFLYFAAIQLSR